jgi:hypothetical protein
VATYTLSYWIKRTPDSIWETVTRPIEAADAKAALGLAYEEVFPHGSMLHKLELVEQVQKKNTNAWKPKRYAPW